MRKLKRRNRVKLKMRLKKIVYQLPRGVRDTLYDLYMNIKYPEMKEVKKSFGEENPEITFYVIRPLTNSVEGLMSLLYNVLLQVSYAEQNGYVPVVDFQNYKTQYNIADENAWEVFFLQISQYTLEEVYHSKNVIISGVAATKKSYKYLQNRSCDKEDIKRTQLFLKKYIKCSKQVEYILENENEKIHPAECIGLYLRGTDYTSLKPVGEPVQPSVKMAIDKVKLYKEKYKIDNVFLVTEDEKIYKEVKNILKDNLRIVSFDSFIKKYDSNEFLAKDGSLDQISRNRHVRGINYLVKILLLSNCRCIIGGKTSGSWAASAFASENTRIEIFQLGEY